MARFRFAMAAAWGCLGWAVLSATATAQEQGAPHTGLIKHAIFTRVFGKPTIPHIMKFVDGPGQPGARKQSSMPTLKPGKRVFAGVEPQTANYAPASQPMQSVDTLADSSTTVAAEPAQATAAPRTFSSHFPWDYGTVAGSYYPSYFVNYSNYLAGYPGGYAGYPGFVGYPGYIGTLAYGASPWGYGGSLGGFPYLAAYQPYGYYGNYYGDYRPWGWGGLSLYTAATYGAANYGFGGYGPGNYAGFGIGNFSAPPYGYGGLGYAPLSSYAGCCYW